MIGSAGVYHLIALTWTLATETLGMAAWARLAYPRPKRAIMVALAVNLLVHTLFWYSQPFIAQSWPWGLYVGEIAVVLIEGWLYMRGLALARLTPWLLSLVLNAISLFSGMWLWQIL